MGAITSTRPELLERPVRIGRVWAYRTWKGMGGGLQLCQQRFHSEEEARAAAKTTGLFWVVERLK